MLTYKERRLVAIAHLPIYTHINETKQHIRIWCAKDYIVNTDAHTAHCSDCQFASRNEERKQKKQNNNNKQNHTENLYSFKITHKIYRNLYTSFVVVSDFFPRHICIVHSKKCENSQIYRLMSRKISTTKSAFSQLK